MYNIGDVLIKDDIIFNHATNYKFKDNDLLYIIFNPFKSLSTYN
ncbi:hypothetical protein LTSEJOH_3187 [Salmonella enterica subsp. enterica serovar Johannesburg str. S5-703]|nr:hypothetical protein LTSEJOH_3187 [Salmonella enterica subsp. enterica serovar Johannesburg str. S5-703]